MRRVTDEGPRSRQRTAVQAGRTSDPLSVRVADVHDGTKYTAVEVIPAPPEPDVPRHLLPRSRRAVSSPFSMRITPIAGCCELSPEIA
jgi:hypothetical protein